MPDIRTSKSSPLRVDKIKLPAGNGYLGMTLCPGKKVWSTFGFTWDRDLEDDIRHLQADEAHGILTIMEQHEFERCKVPDLGARLKQSGFEWWYLSVPDGGVMSQDKYSQWDTLRRELVGFVKSGKNLVVHCRGGLGRTGTFASVLLMDLLGVPPDQAIKRVRKCRPGTIENSNQEEFVLNYRHLNATKYFKPILSTRNAAIAGCLIGGAIGDAFGYAVEFDSLTKIRRQYGAKGITELKLTDSKAIISDDTQMTLFTLQGLFNAFGEDSKPGREKIAEKIYLSYLDWLKTQESTSGESSQNPLLSIKELFARSAPGSTCLSALRSGSCGSIEIPINDSKGCGGVMRVAPVGLIKAFTPEEAFIIGADSAAITHGNPSGYWSAAAHAMIIRLLLDGLDLKRVVDQILMELQRHPSAEETVRAVTKAVELAADGPPATGETVEQLGGGWVGEEALAIGLYAALKGKDFRDAIGISANHSGDSDSTASLTGQILGTRHGLEYLPEQWRDRIELSDIILDLAEKLGRINLSAEA